MRDFSLLVPGLFLAPSLLAPCWFLACSLLAPCLLLACSLLRPCLFLARRGHNVLLQASFFSVVSIMNNVSEQYRAYQTSARQIVDSRPADLDAALTELENRFADDSGLVEGDRLELLAYMVEFRRQAVDGYEAGAETPHIGEGDSGPRSGEYGPEDT